MKKLREKGKRDGKISKNKCVDFYYKENDSPTMKYTKMTK